MAGPEFWTVVDRIRAEDGRYARDAYVFVMEALDSTARDIGERRHVTAVELLKGACGYARNRYGLLSFTVLRSWGIVSAGDVGDIVFQLVDAGILSRRDEDSRRDFDGAADLQSTLEDAYFDPEA